MGEYADDKGQQIKIGTCESMYYLRATQASLVRSIGTVDPIGDRFGIRFRFPFPDEDGTEPGSFAKGSGPTGDFNRCVTVPGLPMIPGVEHYKVQFSAPNGYLVSLPCPESVGPEIQVFSFNEDGHASGEITTKIHHNGYGGSMGVHSQKWVRADEAGPERLVTVVMCKGCGALARLHSWDSAAPIVKAFRGEAERKVTGFFDRIADRMEAGYQRGDEATTNT